MPKIQRENILKRPIHVHVDHVHTLHVTQTESLTNTSRQLRGKSVLTGYCFKYIDGPFWLQTDDLYLPVTRSVLDEACKSYLDLGSR